MQDLAKLSKLIAIVALGALAILYAGDYALLQHKMAQNGGADAKVGIRSVCVPGDETGSLGESLTFGGGDSDVGGHGYAACGLALA